jgi:hypothetical protein
MEHEHQTVDIKEHLRTIAAGLGVVWLLLSGMIAVCAVLVIDGLYYAVTSSEFDGRDFGDYSGRGLAIGGVVMLVFAYYFARFYFRYAARVRQDPSQMIEF